MHSELESIRICFEEQGMTPEEIAKDRSMQLTAVKGVLLAHSVKYRSLAKVESEDKDDFNFTPAEMEDAKRVICNTMHNTDDPSLAFKAAVYVRDDKKGRLDVAKAMQTMNVGSIMFSFNEQLAKAREKRESRRSIDVSSEVTA
jgi:hypothetical protein